jgi:mannose-6-phosphate isomerase-like protein (cupin superfamily)
VPAREFHHARIPVGNSVLAAPAPPDAVGFATECFQLLSNDTLVSWSDSSPHQHSASDEMFVVMEGTVIFHVDGQEVAVAAGEFCAFPAGLTHGVLRAEPPVRCFVLRAPAVADKVYPNSTDDPRT